MFSDEHATKSNKIGGKKVRITKNTNIYPIDSILDNNVNLSGIKRVSICIYRINVKPSSTPFLEYLLFKNRENIMVFPGFIGGGLDSANKLHDSITGKSSKHKGTLRIDDTLYVFYQYIRANDGLIENPYKSKSDELWWCLMDEICNWRKVMSMPVDDRVVGLFYKYPDLIYLYDTNYNKLEVPVVGYHAVAHHNQLEFIYMFGVNESESGAIYGPYYYFTTLDKVSKSAKGVLRTALFMNNMRAFLNHPNDPIDDSEYTADALKDIEHREKMKNILRIVDYDAKWAKDYDSVYSNEKMVVKNNSQQVVLSIHDFL